MKTLSAPPAPAPARTKPARANKILEEDRAAHDWYRFVLSFPPHLVREYLERFDIGAGRCVLDPFCGTGTTLVECKKLGVSSVGLEANPIAHLAASVKTDWSPSPALLLDHAQRVKESACRRLDAEGIPDDPFFPQDHALRVELLQLSIEQAALLLRGSISPLPLHKTLVLLEVLNQLKDGAFCGHDRLALAAALPSGIGNIEFGPEVGVGAPKQDAPVVALWLDRISGIAADLKILGNKNETKSLVLLADSRQIPEDIASRSVDAVITSPPYPNEKDYTRTTRLESVLLGFIHNKADLRQLKQGLMRSNTRNVYQADQDDLWVLDHPEIQRIASEIETRRIALGKTSGFERLYARVAKLYFGGMARHLKDLQRVLKPGAQLAYVVGDQASYLRVMIRTGQILADIAERLGYKVLGIDLFRTRLATATREQLREEVVLLQWK